MFFFQKTPFIWRGVVNRSLPYRHFLLKRGRWQKASLRQQNQLKSPWITTSQRRRTIKRKRTVMICYKTVAYVVFLRSRETADRVLRGPTHHLISETASRWPSSTWKAPDLPSPLLTYVASFLRWVMVYFPTLRFLQDFFENSWWTLHEFFKNSSRTLNNSQISL